MKKNDVAAASARVFAKQLVAACKGDPVLIEFAEYLVGEMARREKSQSGT